MRAFCVYLTIYKGNRLPPFYIGYCRSEIIPKGYRGSVSSREYKAIFRSELKNNPHLFVIKILKEFDSKYAAMAMEIKLQKAVSAHRNPLYMNKMIGYEKFGKMTGHTEESREKMRQAWTPEKRAKQAVVSAARKGASSPLKGKKLGKASDEFKEKRRNYMINAWQDPDTKEKLLVNRKPPTEESKQKASARVSESFWINNGVINKRVCASEKTELLEKGWVAGRLTFKRPTVTRYMNDGKVTRRIPETEIQDYENLGWKVGHLSLGQHAQSEPT